MENFERTQKARQLHACMIEGFERSKTKQKKSVSCMDDGRGKKPLVAIGFVLINMENKNYTSCEYDRLKG